MLDEAQAIKNPDSQTARAAYALPAVVPRWRSPARPVENRLEELWSLMHFTNRGLLGGRSRLRRAPRAARSPTAQPGAAAALRQRDPPVPAAPPEAGRRARAAAAHRRRAARRARRRRARRLRRRPRGDRRRTSWRCSTSGKGVHAGAGGAAAPAPGGLPPGAGPRPDARRPRRSSRRCSRRSTTAVAEGHKALVFSQWTSLLDLIEPRAGARRPAVHAPRRQHPRSRRRGGALPGRRRPARHAGVAEGGRHAA